MKPRILSAARPSLPLASAIAALLSAPYSLALTYYWDGNDSAALFGTAADTWTDPTLGTATSGWSQSSAGTDLVLANSVSTGTGDSINFGTATVGSLATGTINVSGVVNSGDMTFGSGSGPIILSGGTINLAAAAVITLDNSADTISNVLSGAATSLTKAGTGTLTLSGNSTYTGASTVNGGTLVLNNPTSNGFTSALTINNSGTVKLGGTNKVVDTAVVTVNTGGTFDLNGVAETIANSAGSGSVTNTGALATLTMTGAIVTVPNAISGALNLSIQGTSKTYTLTGSNTYTGSTTIGTGGIAATKVIMGSSNALPSGTAITVDGSGSNTALDLNGFNLTVGLVTLGTNNSSSQTAVAGSGRLTLNAGVTLNGHNNGGGLISVTSLDLNGATRSFTITGSNNATSVLTVSSVIQNGGLTITGGGTSSSIVLSGTNTYGGATKVTAGILRLDNKLAMQNSALDTTGAGKMNLNNGAGAYTFGGLSGSTALATVISTGLANMTTMVLNPQVGASNSYSGAIANGSMILTKTGLGIQTLANLNTYTGGTNVNAGTLLLSGAFNMPATGTLTVNGAGNFSLADATVRNTSTAALSLASGANLTFDWSSSGTVDNLTTTAAATTVTGPVGININKIGTPTGGGTLLSSAGGGLNTATYILANNTDFTAALAQSANSLSIGSYVSATPLTAAYWIGGQLTGAIAGAMGLSSGTLSNWASDAAGTLAGGVVPGGAAVNVIFSATGATEQTLANTGANMNLGSITFNDSASVTIGGSNAITLNSISATAASSSGSGTTVTPGSAISVTSSANASNTISANLILGANQTWNVASGANLTVSGIVAGAFSLTKADAGTLTLSGANNYTGATVISAGTLKIGNAAALGANTSSASVTTGAVLDLNGTTLTRTNPLTLNGTGISSGGVLINSSASGATYAGLVTLGSASRIIAGSGNITLSNVGTITGPTFGLTIGGAFNTSIASIIGTTSGALTKQDAGTLTLSNANTYTGGTTIQAGTLTLTNATATGTNTITFDTGGVVNATVLNSAGSSAISVANGITVNATSTGTNTISYSSSNSGTNGGFTGLITANGNLNVEGNVSSVGNNGAIVMTSAAPAGTVASGKTITLKNSGSGRMTFGTTGLDRLSGLGGMAVAGSGTGYIVFNGQNTFSGGVNLSGASGTVIVSSSTNGSAGSPTNGPFGTGTISLGTQILRASATSASFTLHNVITLAGDPTFLTGTAAESGLDFTGPSTLTGNRTLTVNVGGSVSNKSVKFSGAIGENLAGRALTKAGTGTLILAGLNTYTGNTTVSAGTLALADNAQLKFVLGATSGTNNSISGNGTLTLDGDFVIDTSAADSLSSGTWTIVDNSTLTETYTSTFTVSGFVDAGSNKWTKVNGSKLYTFDEATGVLTLASSATYGSWVAGFSLTGADALSTADPDFDGIPNAVEMVLGGNPATGMDTALLSTIELVTDPVSTPAIPAGNYLLFTYRRSAISETALVTAACETDTDLVGPWTTALDTVSGVVIQVDTNFTFTPAAPADTDRVRVYVPRGANPTLFGRLNVTVP